MQWVAAPWTPDPHAYIPYTAKLLPGKLSLKHLLRAHRAPPLDKYYCLTIWPNTVSITTAHLWNISYSLVHPYMISRSLFSRRAGPAVVDSLITAHAATNQPMVVPDTCTPCLKPSTKAVSGELCRLVARSASCVSAALTRVSFKLTGSCTLLTC